MNSMLATKYYIQKRGPWGAGMVGGNLGKSEQKSCWQWVQHDSFLRCLKFIPAPMRPGIKFISSISKFPDNGSRIHYYYM